MSTIFESQTLKNHLHKQSNPWAGIHGPKVGRELDQAIRWRSVDPFGFVP